MRPPTIASSTRLALASALLALGCSSSDGSCSDDSECASGQRCTSGSCQAPRDAGPADRATPTDLPRLDTSAMDARGDTAPRVDALGDVTGEGPCPSLRACGAACCAEGERCYSGRCSPDLGLCTTSDDCQSDSLCERGECVPWGSPPTRTTNPECSRRVSVEALVPAVQCRWTGPPAGDAHPDHFHVMSTPIVVDLDLDRDRTTLAPSIVFASFPTAGTYGVPGVLRVIDGGTCAQRFSLGNTDNGVVAPASVAAGDLDDDGRPELVAVAHGGGLLAFRVDPSTRQLTRLWRSGTCSGATRTPDTFGAATWAGPSLHDLDDDGVPEVLLGGVVYDARGCVLSSALGFPAYHRGVLPVVADVDEDGRMELVFGDGIYQWNPSTRAWVAETYFNRTGRTQGHVAVADLGSFPLAAFGGEDRAEVVVVTSGTVRVQTLEGRLVFGPVNLPGGGSGGPPTIADFDGDGRAEFASAGGTRYAVFDLDCVTGGDPARCNGMARTDGVLWTQPSQDASSNVTGSSVFDFDADGRAEAVYADECFLRIYEGRTGRVLYSAARSSGTTYENPVIADVDGDFRSEIVSSVNDYAGRLGCPATDPLRPSATFSTAHGIVVLRDELDRWAASRPIWNQHAYAVTHVGDRGELPRASGVRRNWRDPTLNNFRQNVQGRLAALGQPDLTTTAGDGSSPAAMCSGRDATLRARVCNRGLLPVGSGAVVAFREEGASGSELCRATVTGAIEPGACAVASCTATLPDRTLDVRVTVDPDRGTDECLEGNNTSILRGLRCEAPPG